jgi:hypothetical protein
VATDLHVRVLSADLLLVFVPNLSCRGGLTASLISGASANQTCSCNTIELTRLLGLNTISPLHGLRESDPVRSRLAGGGVGGSILAIGCVMGGDRAVHAKNQPGARRLMTSRRSRAWCTLKSGCYSAGYPAEYGPHTTVFDRFNRSSRRGFWRTMLAALSEAG